MEGGERRIKLACPSLSKAISMVVAEDEGKVDIGSIGRAFGLDPNSIKLNGYFIARGADHIASSLTWKSLLRFFSARGLPAGAAPLIVHGKLSQIRSKRSHELEDAAKAMDNTKEMGRFRESKRPQHEHRSSIPGLHKSSGSCLKRKWWLEDESRLKRARSDEGRFSCSFISKNLKRMRIDEIVASSPLKKLR